MIYNENKATLNGFYKAEELIDDTTGSAEYDLLPPRRGTLKFEISGTPDANIKITATASPERLSFAFTCDTWNDATIVISEKPETEDIKEGDTIDFSTTGDIINENGSFILKISG